MQRAVNQPVSELTLFAGIFLKTWAVADAGTLLPQHAHAYDHISLIVSGAVRVWRGEELVGDFVAPETIKIAAHEKHSFLTLASGVVIACIHATDAAEVAIVAEHQIVKD